MERDFQSLNIHEATLNLGYAMGAVSIPETILEAPNVIVMETKT